MGHRRWGAVALAVMIVADLVLVGWALGIIGGGDGVEREGASASPTSASASPSSGDTESPTSEPDSGEETPDATRFVVEAAGSTLWRATPGECEQGGARIERSEDGQSWEEAPIDAQAIYRVRFAEPTVGFVVGAGEDCEPVVYATGDGGQSWQEQGAEQTWAALPSGQALVPGGQTVTVCEEGELLGLAATTGSAAWALCDDGRLLRTTSTGQSWDESAQVEGATSLAADQERVAVTSAGEGCEGLRVATGAASDGELGEPSCVKGAAGAVVALGGGGGYLVGESGTWRSEDLQDWSTAS